MNYTLTEIVQLKITFSAGISSKLAEKPLKDLKLRTRILEILEKAEYTYIGDLFPLTMAQLIRTPGFGRKYLIELVMALDALQ